MAATRRPTRQPRPLRAGWRRSALLLLKLLLVACAATPQPTALPTPAATATAVPPAATPITATGTRAPSAAPSAATPTAVALPPGWWDSAVCYEVFVRSFFDGDGDGIGDFGGLTRRLDYINDGDPADARRDLGAGCVWLMPITPSPSYHGYDTTDYYAINPQYGTADDFRRFVAEAHRRGIKVMIDLVLNHTSDRHPWFQAALRDPASPYRDWYIFAKEKPPYRGPLGEAWHKSPLRDEYYYGVFGADLPDLNYRTPAVTAEARKISLFWRNDMGVDGFRLDAIKYLIENGPAAEGTAETLDWWREYAAFLAREAPGTLTIGEVFGGNPSSLAPYYPDQLDFYFQFEVADKTVGAANFGTAGLFLSAVQNATTRLPAQRWSPFLTNHDQNRVMSTLGNDRGKMRIAATALLSLPGLPFVYYGEEIGLLGVKPDERLRTPLPWSGAPGGGFTAGQPWEPFAEGQGQVNVAAQEGDPDSLLNLYRRLIHLHSGQPALARGGFTPLTATGSSVAAFLRQQGDETILVVLNFGSEAASGVGLSLQGSDIAPGAYRLQALFPADAAVAPLTVGPGGAFGGYVPLPTLAPQTGYLLKLAR